MKFMKKPVVVDAERVVSFDKRPAGVMPQYSVQDDEFSLGMETTHGMVRVDVGDWVITEPSGERYPVTHAALMANYELVKP